VGEIFLDEQLAERLRLAEAVPGITSISATTNAVMVRCLDDTALEDVVSRFDCLIVSVYGLDREEYHLMTRRDQYPVFREGLLRILRLAGPGKVALGIRSLRNRSPADLVSWRDQLAQEAGLDELEIHSSTSTFANWSFFDTSQGLPLQATWQPVAVNTKQCGIPLLGLQVLVDGRVSFCACANFDGTHDLIVGSLQEQTLTSMLDADTFGTAQGSVDSLPVGLGCQRGARLLPDLQLPHAAGRCHVDGGGLQRPRPLHRGLTGPPPPQGSGRRRALSRTSGPGARRLRGRGTRRPVIAPRPGRSADRSAGGTRDRSWR
jgi:hypothetical protein